MNSFKTILLAGAFATAAGSAFAADAYKPQSYNNVPVGDFSSSVSVWDGIYGGISAVGVMTSPDNQYGLQGTLGFNGGSDFFLLGVEGSVLGLNDGGSFTAQGQVLGRAGLVLSEEFMIYGAAGVAQEFSGGSDTFGLLGGGIEVAISDDVTLRGQYLYGNELGGAPDQQQVSIGALWHF